MMASRIWSKKQALEKEVKELYLMGTFGYVAATATANLTTDIVYTSASAGPARNTNTVEIVVEAAAANPTDTVLAAWTGTSAAVVITITPNDGTNNTATPVDLTTEELVELINTGAVVGKDVTVTDGSSLRETMTATGGDDTPLAAGGEGDEVEATFSGGDVLVTLNSAVGISSVTRTAAGEYRVNLQDNYCSLKAVKAIHQKATGEDIRWAIKSHSVTTGTLTMMALTSATATDPSNGSVLRMRLDLKNTTA